MWERAATAAADGALYKCESVCNASVVSGSVKVLPNMRNRRRIVRLREGARDGIDTASDIEGACERVTSVFRLQGSKRWIRYRFSEPPIRQFSSKSIPSSHPPPYPPVHTTLNPATYGYFTGIIVVLVMIAKSGLLLGSCNSIKQFTSSLLPDEDTSDHLQCPEPQAAPVTTCIVQAIANREGCLRGGLATAWLAE